MTHVPSVAADFELPLVIARNPARLLLTGLGGVVFVGFGLWMAHGGVTSRRFEPATVETLGWICLLAGLAIIAGVGALVAWTRTRPGLVLDRAGITIYPTLGSPTEVAWADMSGWSVAKLNKEKLLVFGLRDLNGYFASLQGFQRLLAMRRTQRVGSPVSVALGDLMIERETLFERLNQWFRRFAAVDDAAAAAER